MYARIILFSLTLFAVSGAASAQRIGEDLVLRMSLSYEVSAAVKPALALAAAAPTAVAVAKKKALKPWVRLNGRASADGHVQLDWQTNPQQANRAFWVERAAGGGKWEPLAQLPGTDTTAQKTGNQFTDRQPLAAGTYRLLCVVGDSTKLYSESLSVVPVATNRVIQYCVFRPNGLAVGMETSRVRYPITVNVYAMDGKLLGNNVLTGKQTRELLIEAAAQKEKRIHLQVVDATSRVLTTRSVAVPDLALANPAAAAPH
jgi:hypothetical protein